MLNRTVMTGAAPSIVLLVVLLMTGVVGVGEGVTVIALIIAGAVWTARRTETLTPVQPAEAPVDTEPVERRILDELPDPVILLNASRNIISANQAARKLFNITEMGRDLTTALRHPAVLDAVDLSLAGGTPDPVEFELVAGVPVTFEVQVAAVPRPDDEDGVRVVILLHDVTDTKRVDEVRADFVANVSHELRSPLAALAGFIETLIGPREGRSRCPRKVSRHHEQRGAENDAPDRRPPFPVARRSERTHSSRGRGRDRDPHRRSGRRVLETDAPKAAAASMWISPMTFQMCSETTIN